MRVKRFTKTLIRLLLDEITHQINNMASQLLKFFFTFLINKITGSFCYLLHKSTKVIIYLFVTNIWLDEIYLFYYLNKISSFHLYHVIGS